MNLNVAHAIAHQLMTKNNLLAQGWKFNINSRRLRVLGKCFYHLKTIELSSSFVLRNEFDEVEGVVLHEIAHAKVGPGHHHDQFWRAMAVQIGASPNRLNCSATMKEHPWKAICGGCGTVFGKYRRPRRNGQSYCAKCGPDVGNLLYHYVELVEG